MKLDMLKQAPFNLDSEALAWVERTYARLDLDRRLKQLFVFVSEGCTEKERAEVARFQPGGPGRFFGDDPAEAGWLQRLQETADVPLLIGSDLEGSRMSLPFGTALPNSLGLAAANDEALAREVFSIQADEALTAGVNCSFTPLIDINANWRSAIVATRSYGSDQERIERLALSQLELVQGRGVACTAKHWPGEGYDDRDQHLVTTTNPLSLAEWEATFGRLYRAMISKGVKVVMSGHIAFPAFMRSLGITDPREVYRPASINKHLNVTLLRERFGFNGLIISDSTEMAGLTAVLPALQARVEVIKGGCDMIVYTPTPDADVENLKAAIVSGELSEARVDEAVLRVLGLKASLGLHRAQARPKVPLRSPAALDTARRAFLRAPSLVKDTQHLFPLDPKKHRRVLVFSTGVVSPLLPGDGVVPFIFPDLLRQEGFEVTVFARGMEIDPKQFDLVLYLMGEETLIARAHIHLDWLRFNGSFLFAIQRFWHDVPTAMISFGFPYYLYDAPRLPTYVNAYATHDDQQRAVLELVLGRAEWNRFNPVDPFCGLEDARL